MAEIKTLNRYDYVILGADRWALQMGALLKKAERNYLIVDATQNIDNSEELNIQLETRIYYVDKNKATKRFELIDENGNFYDTKALLVSSSFDAKEGQRFEDQIFANSCRPQRTENGLPVISAELESNNIENMFFLGNHTAMRAYGDLSNVGDKAFWVNMLHRFLEQKYHGIDLCRHMIPHDADTVKNLVHNRMNLTQIGWSRPDYIGDFLVVENGGKTARFYSQLTSDYFREHIAHPEMIYYALTIDSKKTEAAGTVVSKCQGWEIISECRLSGDPAQGMAYWNSKIDEIVTASISSEAHTGPLEAVAV